MLRAFRGAVILPDRVLPQGLVLCEGDRILSVGEKQRIPKNAEVIDVLRGYIAPGFVDIHVHGAGGADYMDGTPDAVRTANRVHLRHGTTTIFPTTTTGSPEQVMAMAQVCLAVQRSWTLADGALIGGVDLFGPYFAEEKTGCHAPSGRRDPEAGEYNALFQLRIVRIATCAAELPGAAAFYQAARRKRCLVTCGHSNASWTEMQTAFRAGVRHVDHFWCAMSSVASVRSRLGTPMQGSMEQFVLAESEMSTEVIADGQHLAPELLEFAYRMKGVTRLCLVSDSSRAVDVPPGAYRFGSCEDGPMIESNGKVGYEPGKGLASSVVGMDHMVRTMKKATSAPLHDVIRMASLTPAERTGMAAQVGSLEPGKKADLLVLDRSLRVQRVFVGGQEAALGKARAQMA